MLCYVPDCGAGSGLAGGLALLVNVTRGRAGVVTLGGATTTRLVAVLLPSGMRVNLTCCAVGKPRRGRAFPIMVMALVLRYCW